MRNYGWMKERAIEIDKPTAWGVRWEERKGRVDRIGISQEETN